MNKTDPRPRDLDEYKSWLADTHDVHVDARTRQYYDSVARKIRSDFQESDFWSFVGDNLRTIDARYTLQTGYPLLVNDGLPEVLVKPFDSFLSKTFRKNVVHNRHWPDPPGKEWVLPDNWFSRVGDLVRMLFVVKYLDGVRFLISSLEDYCKETGLNAKASYEARDEGYYAAHFYVWDHYTIPKPDWDTERVRVSVELQVTTQVQEVIRRLLHEYYENQRERIQANDEKWQWNYTSSEFSANYLGHILHYLEGMIMEVRDKESV